MINSHLVVMAKDGDKNAYGELVQMFHGTILSIALRYSRNRQDGDDIVQDAFFRGWKKINQLKDPDCFPGWITLLTRRVAISHMNRKQVRVHLDVNGFDFESKERKNEQLESQELVEKMSMLNEQDREIIEMFYLKNTPIREISKGKKIPLGTVKRRLHTARRRLRELVH